MKNILLLAAAGVLYVSPGLAQYYQGNLDGASCTNIYGWASTNSNGLSTFVDIYDGSTIVQAYVPANIYRPDLGSNSGFSITPPAALVDRRLHQVYVKFSGTQINLSNAPLAMQCTSSSQGYTYYSQSTFGDPGNWTSNGTVSTANNVFSSSSEGSWISNTAVPYGRSDYEVRAILSLKQSGGKYVEYLHATSNAMTGQGTAIQVMLNDPQFSNGGCTAALVVSDVVNGVSTQDGQWTVPCADGMEMRTVVNPQSGGVNWLGVMLGGTAYWTVSSVTSPASAPSARRRATG
jgi:hypothetical protein